MNMLAQFTASGRPALRQPAPASTAPQLIPTGVRCQQQGVSGSSHVLQNRQHLPSVACRAASVERGAIRDATPSQSEDSLPTSLATASIDDTGPTYEGIITDPPARPTGLYVRVRNMVKHFNTAKGLFRAVDGVDVDIEPSSIVALLGPSGSGKTTLLRLVAGLEQPTGGSIFFDDVDATNLSVQDRQIGFVFQSYALFNHKTVAENIKFGLEVRKLNIDHDQRVADLLALVQLQGLGDRYPRQLSGGQRQRVAMARALASNPRLLLLDEPFGALDAVVRKQLRAGLREIVRSVGVTTIIVTHDQEEAFDLADKVVVFNRGLVEQQGKPTDIIKHPRTPFIMKFVGETNVVPATSLLAKRMRFATSKSMVMFRPHDIKLFRSPPPSEDSRVTVAATVMDKSNLGWTIKYTLRFDDDVECELQLTRDQDENEYNLVLGSRVFVHVNPKSMMGFNKSDIDSTPLV
ncbi:hypothetical protein PLESTB_000967100 [Pleodorina starrii]|uniref:ABC transporter domain-containing protein n=1 Tax=Pleodorina starrii TaxID=330485 RepID=A0A9W6F4E0_9CHLO|nr:hypothetical protein PLESTM_001130800 [Pleodorina starrii]GLC55276.1 hypothetical protein PLESTB_000967100 [Pleodorina starrii]GLC70966.1 hypothetical protein PLESTF_001055900 [Pleodorina starrii]